MPQRPTFAESVALMALLISLVALSIDAMLPALPAIGTDLSVGNGNDIQLVVSALFLGLALGQLFYGPISDSTGRKGPIMVGLALFMGGCVLTALAPSFRVLLIGRFIQGLGVAGPRVVTVALIRDQYEGRTMARVMSFIMGIFILIPIIAPAFGQAMTSLVHWRFIFVAFLVLAAVAAIWLALRQSETLPGDRRAPLSVTRILASASEVLTQRAAIGYTVAAGLIYGAFVAYLGASQQIFQDIYGVGARFPAYFGVLAVAIGSASFCNARLVMTYGMRPLVKLALIVLCALSAVFCVLAWSWQGRPPLYELMPFFLCFFFCFGILFGNFNALAMEPLGHIAGIGSAVVGSTTTLLSMLLGAAVGRLYDGTVMPLVIGFTVLGLSSLAIVLRLERAE